jgi:hypothetical protein
MRRLGSLLTAVVFLVFLMGLSPHLVHHVFDEHDDLASPEVCALASAGERQQSDTPGEIALPDRADHADRACTAGTPVVRRLPAAGVPGTRAPPAAA